MLMGMVNEKAIGVVGGWEIVNMVIHRLYILANLHLFIPNMEALKPHELAVELVKCGACDPVKIFIKMEPHNRDKVTTGRLRLISSVSLVDQLVERVLFSNQNKREIRSWQLIPSKPGMGLDDDSIKAIWSIAKEHLLADNLVEADLSAFDITTHGWELMTDVLIRTELAGLTYDSPGRSMFINRGHCVANTVFVLSDGSMWAQLTPGVQLSGSFNTSATNSRIRVLQAYMAGASWAMAMGDDCLEGRGDPQVYVNMGKTLKMYNSRIERFEFCSHIFRDGIAYPKDASKTFFRLLNQPPSVVAEYGQELLAQFIMVMRHHPDLHEMLAVLKRVGWGDPQNHGE